jgi:LmbE family N-acetylglucosaminyl deacetylase
MRNSDRKLEIVTAVPESAMVVFAHPDDAEIGSGGVIATWVAAGCEVSYVLCTNGDAGTADRSLRPSWSPGPDSGPRTSVKSLEMLDT